jgi:uncharacterized protein YndB with AHSA1/START domain
MIQFTIDTQIARPAANVFAYVADPTKLSTWQTNTVSITVDDGGPMRRGARLHEIHRAPGGREIASVVEVAAYEPGRLLDLRMIDGPLPIHARIELTPSDAGETTELRFTAHGRPTGAARLAEPLLRRLLRRQFQGYCATLKTILEDRPAISPS